LGSLDNEFPKWPHRAIIGERTQILLLSQYRTLTGQ